MATRITDKPAIDRSKYPKQMIFVDKEGYVCVADRPKGISEEEKTRRQKARTKAKEETRKERQEVRAELQAEKATEKVERAEEAVELRKAISEANADYKEAVKTKDSRVIGKALDELNSAQAAYNKFKGK